jgi:adenylylsulfate kinase
VTTPISSHSDAASGDARPRVQAPVIWLTGKPNAGKTTLAMLLAQHLRQQGRPVEVLDGNELRQWLSSELGFSAEDRFKHVLRVARLAKLLSGHGVWCVAAIIAPYRSLRQQVREMLGGGFLEIFLDCSPTVLAQRDTKNLYDRAQRGELTKFTGISDPYEEPLSPDLKLDTERHSSQECLTALIDYLRSAPNLRDGDRSFAV